MTTATATIHWLTAAEGGRSRPFIGKQYATVSRFKKGPDNWSDCWSLVVDFIDDANKAPRARAQVRFLVPEAPHHLLHAGTEFALFEGSKKVAEGEILSASVK